ncbi:MAG: hypothetical protein WDN46_16435 [Methylocella sp.]
MQKLIACAIVTTSLLFAATAEAKHGHKMMVEVLKSQEVTMAGGVKATVDLVKMHGGKMMVGIPLDKIPPEMYEQLCARGYCHDL